MLPLWRLDPKFDIVQPDINLILSLNKEFANMNTYWKSSFKRIMLAVGFLMTSIIHTDNKMPSVADVFGGLSEQEIAQQVQMGQKFLEDLDKHGTPEEKAQFEKMLIETLNSMTDDDFKDIQAIAQMVEPHIAMPEEPKSTTPETKDENKKEKPAVQANETDDFKTLISTITQRIDDILQKLNSSKECQEEIDARWKSKTTFSNMKRQIYLLKNDRLAQKLVKKDLDDAEKKLIDTLKKFLKDLTKENDSLAIEDDFGLPSSYSVEQKHLKQTKSILSMFDDYIDSLMPMIEKFLQKHDPEALAMAKESDEKSKKAVKDATDATARKASPDARPAAPTQTGSQRSSQPGGAYPADYGSYPEYYDQGRLPGSNGAYPQGTQPSEGAGSSATPKSKSEIAPTATAKDKEKTKDKNDTYNYIISELEGHMADDYPATHEEKFINFMQKDIADNYTVPLLPNASNPDDLTAWVNTFESYAKGIKERYTKEFATKEIEKMHNLLHDTKESIPSMTEDELTKLSSSKELLSIEGRVSRYEKAFNTMKDQVEGLYNTTFPQIDQMYQKDYQSIHNNSLINGVVNPIGQDIESLKGTISSIKHSAKRVARRKKTEKAIQ